MEYKEKRSKKPASRGFYLVLAGCLVATGVAAWSAYTSWTTPDTEEEEQNSGYIASFTQEDETPAATEASELYTSAESSTPTPEAPTEVIAESFMLPINGDFLKTYSDSELVYSKTFKDLRLHTGLDIKGKKGDIIKACGDGKVISVVEESLLGTFIEIDHGNGIVSRYCGLDDLSVKKGDTVNAGQKIALLGEIPNECADDIHLHLEFFEEEYSVDPLLIINGKN